MSWHRFGCFTAEFLSSSCPIRSTWLAVLLFSWHYFRKFQLTCGWFAGFWGLLGEGKANRRGAVWRHCSSRFLGWKLPGGAFFAKMTNSKWQLTGGGRRSIEIVRRKRCKGSATKKLSAVRGNNQQKASWTGDAGQQKWLNGSGVAAALAEQQAVTWIGFKKLRSNKHADNGGGGRNGGIAAIAPQQAMASATYKNATSGND